MIRMQVPFILGGRAEAYVRRFARRLAVEYPTLGRKSTPADAVFVIAQRAINAGIRQEEEKAAALEAERKGGRR